MTQIEIQTEVASAISSADGPIELVDPSGRAVGKVHRPPTDAEITRALQRSRQGGPRFTFAQMVAQLRDSEAQ